MAIPKNFWIPPAQGYDSSTQGLTESQLNGIESRNGFPFTTAYRSLMQQQNGGTLRYSILQDLLIEEFSCLSATTQEFVTFADYMLLTCTQEDISAIGQRVDYCDPKRLIIFAHSGHAVGCFDYGWKSETVFDNPKIVFFSDDGDEFLQFRTIQDIVDFDRFVDQLPLSDDMEEEIYIGIESSLDFDALCAYLEDIWDSQFELQTDDRYGWFNFEKWFYGNVPLYLDDQTLAAYAEETNTTITEVLDWVSTEGRRRLISATISPNLHRSGTHLYPDNPEITLVLEIDKPWFPTDRAINRLCNELITSSNILTVKKLL
jgi:SMI1-KNR4 cell-wall